MFKPFIILVSR